MRSSKGVRRGRKPRAPAELAGVVVPEVVDVPALLAGFKEAVIAALREELGWLVQAMGGKVMGRWRLERQPGGGG